MEEKKTTIFTPDSPFGAVPEFIPDSEISEAAAVIEETEEPSALRLGEKFSCAVEDGFIVDFEKGEYEAACGKAEKTDLMVHVSTFVCRKGRIYMTYYASNTGSAEDPNSHIARFAFCPEDDPKNKTFFDIQAVGDSCYDGKVVQVYDTILMPFDEDTIFILWTANVSGTYYRLYRKYSISENRLGDVQVNRFRCGEAVNDFSTSGIKSALAACSVGMKTTYSDIGIMQKVSCRIENGEKWFYSGTYSGDFNCIIKSRDLVTWEYVSQPDFPNRSKWENAVYVLEDRVYYFVRQHDTEKYGFLTCFDLEKKEWAKPVLVADCQSRSDFILYRGKLYLFHAPTDREHLGVLYVDRNDLAKSRPVLRAHMKTSCFYPFVEYTEAGEEGKLLLSYTVNRKHIRLAAIDPKEFLQ